MATWDLSQEFTVEINIQKWINEEQDGGVGEMWGTSLSIDTRGIHLSDRSASRTPVQSWQEYLTKGKEYIEPCKAW